MLVKNLFDLVREVPKKLLKPAVMLLHKVVHLSMIVKFILALYWANNNNYYIIVVFEKTYKQQHACK